MKKEKSSGLKDFMSCFSFASSSTDILLPSGDLLQAHRKGPSNVH